MDNIKSRYEVIAELEDRKRRLIMERDGMQDKLLDKQKQLKHMQRELDDYQGDIEKFTQIMEKAS